MRVPFVDLKAQYHAIQPAIDAAIASVIKDTAFIKGKYVKAFEQAFAEAYGVAHCLGVGNGTDAIYIALKALGIGAGDEVITVANSWISTSETITQAGATPVFVDIDPDTYTIDAGQITAKISPRTKAVIPVHLYGQPAEIDQIAAICRAQGLHLIEDCAQAHFVTYGGRRVGTFGDIATFSFYPGKNLGAYGDAGAIITQNEELAARMRMFANHGALKKHQHQIEGINSRLDGLQAAILSAKLPHIHDWNRQRYEHARRYNQLLAGVAGVEIPVIRREHEHIFHLYVIRSGRREALRSFLAEQGIETAVHYPTALPLLPAYHYLGVSRDDIPVAAAYQDQILSLPMFPELSREQQDYVVEKIRSFMGAS